MIGSSSFSRQHALLCMQRSKVRDFAVAKLLGARKSGADGDGEDGDAGAASPAAAKKTTDKK